MLDATNLLGMLAGTLTTVSFVPQVVRIWKTRSTHDLSLMMFLIFATGVACWFGYGLILGALPIILANGVTLVLVCIILYFKFRYH